MAKKEIKLNKRLVIKGAHPGAILRDELEERGISPNTSKFIPK
jgi:hypothetical protein